VQFFKPAFHGDVLLSDAKLTRDIEYWIVKCVCGCQLCVCYLYFSMLIKCVLFLFRSCNISGVSFSSIDLKCCEKRDVTLLIYTITATRY
jgi:hypothetical protein